MSELRDLIRIYPELGEVLADIENKIAYLENSQSIEPVEQRELALPILPPEHRLYGELQQLKGMLLYFQQKLNEHTDKSKHKSKY